MSMQVAFIDPDDSRWFETLDFIQHDFYHLPGYTTFCAKHSGGRGVAFWGHNNNATLLIPLVLRPMPQNLNTHPVWQDAVSPYGYASPLATPCDSRHYEAELWRAFKQCCSNHSIISVFLRFNPLLPMSLASRDIGEVVEEGETVFFDLSTSYEDIFRQFRENHRRGIRKLREAGFHAVIDDWSGLERFIALYRDTMCRAGATEEYFFDNEYFHDLVALDKSNIHLCAIMAPNGEIAAAGIFLCCCGIVQFHLSGTAENFLSCAPTKLMFDEMIRWSKAHGFSFLHLGGGVGCQRDSLLNFKTGFSNLRGCYYTCRVVTDEAGYDACVRAWTGMGNEYDKAAGYFPLYRR